MGHLDSLLLKTWLYQVDDSYFSKVSKLQYSFSANIGLLDQTLALKWIKENIDLFGGVAERVTILGNQCMICFSLDFFTEISLITIASVSREWS